MKANLPSPIHNTKSKSLLDYSEFYQNKREHSMISLFSGGGIGDIGFVAAGYKMKLANEIVEDRATLLKHNFPDAKVFVGDIWHLKEKIVAFARSNIANPFLLFATPPCQGMSPNGAGTLLRRYREGKRPKLDPRNRLILPALHVISQVRPIWIIFENVPKMLNTVIMDEKDELRNIMNVIEDTIRSEYVGCAKVLEFADYGLPQRRKRLITIFTRNEIAKKLHSSGYELHPPTTHDAEGKNGKQKWITLREALKDFLPLDAKSKKTASDPNDPLHTVPVLDPKKYEWIAHTPENSSAFDNQCINPECGYQGNPTHGAKIDLKGINRAKTDTPLYCAECGSLLPRPYVEKHGEKRIMRGYISAYKRMAWDLPASTITRNFSFPCSDHKIHPSENRVLSISEACNLQSISDYKYSWGPIHFKGKRYAVAPKTLIRNVIGESVPPLITNIIGTFLKAMSEGEERLHTEFPETRRMATLDHFG